MEDDEKNKNLERNVSRKRVSNIFNVGSFLQPIWVRCGSVFSDITDRKFMESELRFVLYCGGIFWALYLLSQII
jgi:hypothetical protein